MNAKNPTVDDFECGDKMSKSNLASLPPFAQGRNLDNSRWYMGNMMTFLVNSAQTDGAFSIAEYLSKPGYCLYVSDRTTLKSSGQSRTGESQRLENPYHR
jgi:hypothetical protein